VWLHLLYLLLKGLLLLLLCLLLRLGITLQHSIELALQRLQFFVLLLLNSVDLLEIWRGLDTVHHGSLLLLHNDGDSGGAFLNQLVHSFDHPREVLLAHAQRSGGS